jgi:hypothetical protein
MIHPNPSLVTHYLRCNAPCDGREGISDFLVVKRSHRAVVHVESYQARLR